LALLDDRKGVKFEGWPCSLLCSRKVGEVKRVIGVDGGAGRVVECGVLVDLSMTRVLLHSAQLIK